MENQGEDNKEDEESSDDTFDDEEDDKLFLDALDHQPPKLPSFQDHG